MRFRRDKGGDRTGPAPRCRLWGAIGAQKAGAQTSASCCGGLSRRVNSAPTNITPITMAKAPG